MSDAAYSDEGGSTEIAPIAVTPDDNPAASPSREALRRIRELEAINAQITRHRDQLGAALRRLANYEGISTPCDNRNCSECRTAKIAREALNG